MKDELEAFNVVGLIIFAKTDVASDIVFNHPKLIGLVRLDTDEPDIEQYIKAAISESSMAIVKHQF